jgi:hypothetical protein
LKAWAGWLAFLAAQSCFQDLPRRVSARGVVGDGLAAWWLRTSGEEAAFEVTFLSRAAVKQVDAAGPIARCFLDIQLRLMKMIDYLYGDGFTIRLNWKEGFQFEERFGRTTNTMDATVTAGRAGVGGPAKDSCLSCTSYCRSYSKQLKSQEFQWYVLSGLFVLFCYLFSLTSNTR